MSNKKTAVFGSAFNPPHMGHADVVDQALAHFDRVILVPNFAHAFGKVMAPYPLRLRMTNALVIENGWDRVDVSNIEASIAAKKSIAEAIYTFDVLEALEADMPKQDLTFIIGPDNATPEIWQQFYNVQELDKRWGHWCAEERKLIRSTSIRDAIYARKSIDHSICPASIIKIYTTYLFQKENT